MAGYPSREEFFALGLPAKAFLRQPQTVAETDAAANVLTVPGHGLSNGDRVRLTVNPGGGGAPVGALPAGLSASTLYYVIGVDVLGADMLQLALTSGGSAVDFTDAGSPVFGVALDPGARIDLALDAWSRHADQHLKGHSTPLVGAAPLQLKLWVCQLAAQGLATSTGLVDPNYAKDPALAARAIDAQRQLDRLLRDGDELAGAVVDQTPNVIDNAAHGFGDPARCWDPGGFL